MTVLALVLGVAIAAAVLFGAVLVAALAAVAGFAQALAKLSLDALIQRDVPEVVRTSAFARSETLLQMAWVVGGAHRHRAAAERRAGHVGRRGRSSPPGGWRPSGGCSRGPARRRPAVLHRRRLPHGADAPRPCVRRAEPRGPPARSASQP